MATPYYVSPAGAGTKSGLDTANAGSVAELQSLVDGLTVAGDILYAAAGTYALPALIDIDNTVDGTNANRILIIGVNASTWLEDGSIAYLDAGNTYTNAANQKTVMHYWGIRNVGFINATGDGFTKGDTLTSNYWYFYNCVFNDNGADGFGISNGRLRQVTLAFCEAKGNVSEGFRDPNYGDYAFCQALDNGSWGFDGRDITHCLAHNNGGALGMRGYAVTSCISDGNSGNGIQLSTANAYAFANRLTHNGGYGILSTSVNTQLCGNNAFYNNTSGQYSGDGIIQVGFDTSMAGDGYTDRANDDFTLTSSAEALSVETPVGLIDEATNIFFPTSGIKRTSDAPSSPVTFAGIVDILPTLSGVIRPRWVAGTGSIAGYNIYIRAGSSDVFSSTYLATCARSDATGYNMTSEKDGITFFQPNTTYYIGIKAVDSSGIEDANTVVAKIKPSSMGVLIKAPFNVVVS